MNHHHHHHHHHHDHHDHVNLNRADVDVRNKLAVVFLAEQGIEKLDGTHKKGCPRFVKRVSRSVNGPFLSTSFKIQAGYNLRIASNSPLHVVGDDVDICGHWSEAAGNRHI